LLKEEEKLRLEKDGVLQHPKAPLQNELMFPSKVGTLRTPNTAGITKRFTIHGLR
jgi:hypothetical protein